MKILNGMAAVGIVMLATGLPLIGQKKAITPAAAPTPASATGSVKVYCEFAYGKSTGTPEITKFNGDGSGLDLKADGEPFGLGGDGMGHHVSVAYTQAKDGRGSIEIFKSGISNNPDLNHTQIAKAYPAGAFPSITETKMEDGVQWKSIIVCMPCDPSVCSK